MVLKNPYGNIHHGTPIKGFLKGRSSQALSFILIAALLFNIGGNNVMYSLEWEPNGVYWKYYGDVSGKEIIEASIIIYSDPRFDNLRYKMVDFLDTQSIQMDADEIAEIAYQHRAAALSNLDVKTAIVTTESGIKKALSFASFFKDSSWEVKVFQDLAEANNWAGRKQ